MYLYGNMRPSSIVNPSSHVYNLNDSSSTPRTWNTFVRDTDTCYYNYTNRTAKGELINLFAEAPPSRSSIPHRLKRTTRYHLLARKWLTHTVYETKGVSPYIGWSVAFHWVRVRVTVRVSARVYQ